ncbi:MAG: hypothetical protein ACYTHK_17315 [Planctomycetota bacterium]
MRALLLPFLVLAACSGGGSSGDESTLPPTSPGLPPSSPGGGSNRPPATDPVDFDGTWINLGKDGGYPSDLEIDRNGSLYTVSDAMIPATVLGAGQSVPITATDLIDADGRQPAAAPAAYDLSTGLFGAFTGDIEVVFERWCLVTVGAGNSLGALRLANLVVIDMQAGRVVQTVNLAWLAQHSGTRSGGAVFPHIPQSLPSQVTFVPDKEFPSRGRVYVTLSNGAGTANGITNWYPGTVQIWTADFSAPLPLSPDTAGRNPAHLTRVFVSDHYNPVGLTQYRNGANIDYLLLTNAGTSSFDANWVAIPQSNAAMEVLDLTTRQWKRGLELDLGPILPAPQRMALGRDADGELFGALSSQTFSAVYLLDLAGLDNEPATPLAFLRTIELQPGGSASAGSGFHPGIGLTPSSRTLVVSTFFPAKLFVVALPADLRGGAAEVNPDPYAELELDASGGLGALVVTGNGAYVINNGTFVPAGPAHVASLTTRDGLR